MFLPDYLIDLLKEKGYKESSVNKWNRVVRNVFRQVWGDEEFTPERFASADECIPYFERIENVNTRFGYLYPMLVVGEALGYEMTLLRRYYDDVVKEKEEVRLCPEEEYPEVSWEEFKRRFEAFYFQVDPTSKRDMRNLLIGGFYIYMYPMRPQNLCRLRVLDTPPDEDEENYLALATRMIRVVHHKTERSRGAYSLGVPDILLQWIRLWMDLTGLKYGDYLFGTVGSDSMSQALKRHFGLSPGMVRKVRVSHEVADIRADDSLSQHEQVLARKKIADAMGHSLGTQEFTYNRFEKSIKKEEKEKDIMKEKSVTEAFDEDREKILFDEAYEKILFECESATGKELKKKRRALALGAFFYFRLLPLSGDVGRQIVTMKNTGSEAPVCTDSMVYWEDGTTVTTPGLFQSIIGAWETHQPEDVTYIFATRNGSPMSMAGIAPYIREYFGMTVGELLSAFGVKTSSSGRPSTQKADAESQTEQKEESPTKEEANEESSMVQVAFNEFKVTLPTRGLQSPEVMSALYSVQVALGKISK